MTEIYIYIYNQLIPNLKKVVISILTPDEDFRAKNITRENEGHFIMTKGLINQTDVIILYFSVPKNMALKGKKKKS